MRGAAGSGEGALLGRSRVWGPRAGDGRAAHGTDGGAGARARARARGKLPGPIPLPGARFPRPELFSGPLGAAGAGSPERDSAQPATPEETLPSCPGARAAASWGRPEGGRGCSLGSRRMSEGRATTSCFPRPPEQKPDLLGSC